ncbi:putative membrane protein YccC [Rhodoblastus acidophilus]|uniref:FUSC family protein n=1 Tax=Rhodoblastus acidophilus TaxID=1074 RepID=UPI002224036E|nr:FUSC family protein [Rhodoblastus acidophilus]MCW2283751.1 putative membrane protein YccC [Rhodoblastus acidophilus]MCW2332900.1 putative membrane protein YccC [Rhodoblastus acidophilus]
MTVAAAPMAPRGASAAPVLRIAAAQIVAAPAARLRALFLHLMKPATALHAARTTIAGLTALWLAFVFQVEMPFSALTTVMLVSNPVQGMILEKSLYRLGGTLLGGVAALALMALFAQTPELFLLGLAVWMALCTAASTLLRGHRSYGAVLAGYTVALISLPAVETPESIFSVTMARVGAVTIGVVTSALVGALLTGHTAQRRLDALLRALLADLVGVGRAALQGGSLSTRLHAFSVRLGGLDDAIRFAVVETPEVAARGASLRAASAAMHGVLSAARGLSDALAHPIALVSPVADWLREVEALLARAEAALERRDAAELEKVAVAVRRLADELDAFFSGDAGDAPNLSEDMLILADRLGDFLDELARSLAGLTKPDAADGEAPPARIAIHLDWAWAGLNAARAAIAVLVAGGLWLGLAWPLGASMMLAIIPTIGLNALRERPSADVLQFAWGTVAAALLGLFYLLWVLPQINSFALLAMWLAPPLAFCAAAVTMPSVAFFALGLAIFLVTLLAPSNPMVFDPSAFLNNALATTAGCVITALIFQIVLPVDARRLKRHLMRGVQRDVIAVLRSGASIDARQWDSRMHDRMRLLSARLRAANIDPRWSMGAAFDALRLGREVFRLRALTQGDAELAAATEASLIPIAEGRSRGEALKTFARTRDWLEDRRAARPDEAARILRIEAALTSIGSLHARGARFFQQAAQFQQGRA